MLLDELARLGLSGKKGRFYLAALEMGEASVNAIAERADIGRTTAYNVLSGLVNEGLLTQIQKSGKTYVVAEDPETMLHKLDERRRNLKRVIPEIRAVFNSSIVKPRIHYYEGVEGIVTAIEDTLKCHSKVLRGILSMRELLNTPGQEFMQHYIKRRIEMGIQLKVVRAIDEEVGEVWKSLAEELREVRFAPQGTVFTMTLYIYDDTVTMVSSRREDFAVRIESAEFARLQEALFETMWANSKPGAA